MMENYAEASVSYVNTTKGLVEVRDVKIEERDELSLLDTEFNGSSQKYDFGAEIVKTQSQQHYLQAEVLKKHTTDEEAGIKTNPTKTLTATACELSVLDVEEAAKTIETPVNSVSTCPELELDKEQPENVDEDADEDDDDDDDDSYQSEEEDNERRRRRAYNHSGDGQRDAASQDSDESTTDSDFSDLSGLSDMSGREWKPISARPINWVQRQIHSGANPRDLLSQMLPSSAHQIAPGLTDMTLWRILASLISEPPRRQKLRYINTFEDVVQLVLQSQNIIVLTGAGVSVSCGIPDFRSSDGIYSRLAKDFPDLPDPQAMFDINYFSRDPRPFYKFAREIYPGQFKPSPCHRFIKLLEGRQKLLRNYTQNIDTLEQVAGIKNVIECHGSFSTASCTKCKHKCNADAIRPDIFAQRIPVCPRCQPNVQQSVDASEPVSELELKRLVENGIMKPDIVFFGEGLPQEFHTVMASDKDKCDLLIVMGSSLKVRPVALIPSSIPANVPQILINREQLHHLEFDVELLGDSDVIINQLCHHLAEDWKQICFSDEVLKESKDLLPLEEDSTTECEEDVPQLQDTDTQSIKSNASTDIALRSAGAFSDSGFESSTSSGGVLGKITGDAAANEDIKAIKQLKNASSLELNDDPLSQTKCVNSLPPDLLDEPTETIDDYGNADFHPFAERLGQRSTLCTENYRHLSIDSSKDSGIQGDSSNSALASGSTSTLLPPITSFGDSGGTAANSRNCLDNVSASQKVSAEPADRTVQIATAAESNKVVATNAESDMKRRQQKRQSAAERLIEGTYYCHESSSSYVFPGAQVSWSSESEEEDNDDDNAEEHGHVDFNEDDTDANGAPLSPLLPPSVEAEVVSEITTTNAFATCIKRPSSDNLESEVLASTEISTCANAMSCATIPHKSNIKTAHRASSAVSNRTTEMLCSPPPTKRRRNSSESPEHMNAEVVVTSSSSSNSTTSTFITTTTINTSDSSSNSLETSNKTEAWLQQF